MASEGVQPLRINKGSPCKMTPSAIPRPLSEISPMGVRRNSPSFNQTHIKKPSLSSTRDSSPFDASPTADSPLHSFWKSRENASPHLPINNENTPLQAKAPSPAKRSSIENLKKASRVTNSTMYAREQEADFDPDSSSVVSTRPLSSYSANVANVWGDLRSNPSFRGHRRTESNNKIPALSRTPSPAKPASPSPTKQTSPHKSSLSVNSRYGPQSIPGLDASMLEDGTESRPDTRSNTPRALRAPKSVTFDAQPPQINEYEKMTPDPSSVASGSREGSQESDLYDMDDSFEHGSFECEDSFDESLEDAHKTPVVLPEDWRFMSPEAANTDLAETFDDPFEKPQPAFASPSLRYRGTPERVIGVTRSNSVTSSGEHRPLPPLPAGMAAQPAPSSHPTFTGNRLDPNFVEPAKPFHDEQLAEMDDSGRATSASSTSAVPVPRPASMVSPPRPASMSKADVLGMRASPMPLEDRLQLLSIQNEEAARKAKDAEARLAEQQVQVDREIEPVTEYKPPPRVSRESILRKVKNRSFDDYDQESSPYSHVAPSTSPHDEIDYANLDPDVPIPSRETSSAYEDDNAIPIKREEDNGSTIDMYAQMNGEASRSMSPFDDFARESSVIHHHIPDEEDTEISNDETVMVNERPVSPETQLAPSERVLTTEERTVTTEATDAALPKTLSVDNSRMSLPEFSAFFDKDDFGFGLTSYLTPSPPQEMSSKLSTASFSNHVIERKPILRPATPPQQHTPSMLADKPDDEAMEEEEQVRTPDSVIHHPTEEQLPIEVQAPEVLELRATIKASGSRLKTRISATPADLHQMAASRRQVSGELPPPHINEPKDGSRPSSPSSEQQLPAFNRRQSIRKLEMPMDGLTGSLGFGLDEEFDRLLEAKKKGYVTREATKVVVANSRHVSGESKASETSTEEQSIKNNAELRPASARGTKSAGNSPHKDAANTWTTEPWNGRMRRQSTRRTNIVPDKRTSLGPVPPLPGQESNVASALDTVTEDQNFDDADESGERGRLFVKVVGVKDLDLPLPKNERSYFQMTLDNGLHCVTTSWAELGKTAPIGQEFELVVFDDLEFQLLLQTRLERPKSAANSVQSCASSTTTKKASAFSRLFVSPKKRREAEKKQQEEEARLAKESRLEIEAQRASRQPSAWDLQNELVGPDGSFARAYVALSNHEQHAYGRPFTVDVPAWNEWAVEDKTGASTRSKMGGVQRKPPYKIGNIELQLMYIPRPRGATDEDMPKSMSAAIRQLKEAEATVTRQFEGHLSQQGGDCPYWRRRFFKLNGSKLTAYHDMTRQPRATISLAKATKLIDDKSSLAKTEDTASPKKGKGRRKSAFAEDEEGYMFIEDAFRLKFANGEVIDFYADNRQTKDDWMRVLGEAVGRESPGEKKTWMSQVLDRERAALAAQAPPTKLLSVQRELVQPRNTSKSAPTSPRKEVLNSGPFTNAGLKELRPPPIEKSPRHEVSPPSPTKSKHRMSASTSAVASPSKMANNSRSPLKRDSSPSKRSSAVTGSTSSAASASSSPRKPVTSKRMAVRSMIF